MVLRKSAPAHASATKYPRHGKRPGGIVTIAQLSVLALVSAGLTVTIANAAHPSEHAAVDPVVATVDPAGGDFNNPLVEQRLPDADRLSGVDLNTKSSVQPSSLPQVTISVEDVEVVGFDVKVQSEIVAEDIEFRVIEQKDSSLLKGTRKVKTEGVLGERVTTFVIHRDSADEVVERTQVAAAITREPVDHVVLIGTRVPPPPPVQQPAPAPTGSSGQGGTTPAQAKAIAKTMAAERYGWTGQEYQCLLSLWTGESGWRYTAANPTSTARGIPQAMMSIHFGRSWRTSTAAQHYLNNADVQIAWGLSYIKTNRNFSSPCGAYNFWLRQSPHWY